MADRARVAVIAPHPDDEAVGCGGAIARHTARGDRVSVFFLTSGELGLKHLPKQDAWDIREAEAEAARQVLGISSIDFLRGPDWFVGDDVNAMASALSPLLLRDLPDIVYLPHPGEWHPDHQACLPVTLAALRLSNLSAASLRTYEIWTPLAAYDYVEDITTVVRQKMRAIRCYRSQLESFRYDRAIRGLNQYRGTIAARCPYAEVFKDASGAAGDET